VEEFEAAVEAWEAVLLEEEGVMIPPEVLHGLGLADVRNGWMWDAREQRRTT
jgi:hypothetical protein